MVSPVRVRVPPLLFSRHLQVKKYIPTPLPTQPRAHLPPVPHGGVHETLPKPRWPFKILTTIVFSCSPALTLRTAYARSPYSTHSKPKNLRHHEGLSPLDARYAPKPRLVLV